MKDPAKYIDIEPGLAWFVLAVILMIRFRKEFALLVQAAVSRVQRGDAFTFGILTIGQDVGQLQSPVPGELMTDDHLALVHRSWRVPQRDPEFNGQRMYQIHLVVFGTEEALRRVEYVVYRLEPCKPTMTY